MTRLRRGRNSSALGRGGSSSSSVVFVIQRAGRARYQPGRRFASLPGQVQLGTQTDHLKSGRGWCIARRAGRLREEKGGWLWLNRQCRETTDRAGGQQALEVVLIGCNQSMLGFSSRQGADLLAARSSPWGCQGWALPASAGWLAQIAGCGRILAQSIVELQQLHPMQCRIGLVWQITSARVFLSDVFKSQDSKR